MDYFFSIVIPVYKVEKNLERCIDSVINQDYSNWEIILVDDGSPDRCPQICDEYAEKYSNISVIHQDNMGLSDARNSGLKKVSGDLVLFLDSDDWFSEDALKTIANCFPSDADLLFMDYTDVYYEDNTALRRKLFKQEYIDFFKRRDL